LLLLPVVLLHLLLLLLMRLTGPLLLQLLPLLWLRPPSTHCSC
jgi:hypothetical protein